MSVQNGAFTRTYSFSGEGGKCLPMFEIQTIQDEAASAREGRPIFSQREIVKLVTPGALNVPAKIVNDEIKQKYAKEYEAWKAGIEPSVDGTPLEEWPALNRAQVLELKALGFRTVENLAEMSDVIAQRLRHVGPLLRERAKSFLDDSYRIAEQEKLAAVNAKQESELAELRQKVGELSALVDNLHSQLQTQLNKPSEIATYVPGAHDPVQQARAALPAEPAATSSLDSLAAQPRRRGRPPKNAAA